MDIMMITFWASQILLPIKRPTKNMQVNLPKEALAQLSPEQQSYIDEFTFIQKGNKIQGWYAGELLATWNGFAWVSETEEL